MPYDDKRDDPISGLGDEILPERGLPFEVEEEDASPVSVKGFEKPREVTDEELALLMGLPERMAAKSLSCSIWYGSHCPCQRQGFSPRMTQCSTLAWPFVPKMMLEFSS